MDMNQLMKQAKKMQEQMEEEQEKIKNSEYLGKSGAGAVEVVIVGSYKMKRIKINKEHQIFNNDDSFDFEMLEDLIAAAYNDAFNKCEQDSKNYISGMMGNMKLPPGFKMPF